MKKKLRYFILVLLLIPIMCFLPACDSSASAEIISIEKTASVGYVDTYTITYNNGKTYDFTVTNGSDGKDGINGKDGQSYDITEIYNKLRKTGYEGDFSEFLKVYLNYNDDLLATNINKALLSVVSVYSNFTKQQRYSTFPWGETNTREIDYTSAGSGVIYSLDKNSGSAYIITNYHVVYDSDNITTENGISKDIKIYLYGYEEKTSAIGANFYGGSMEYDIAVLKVEDSQVLKNSDAQAVEIADSNDINVGDKAIAIGNPEALGISATSGIISVDSEYISMSSLDGNGYVKHRVIRVDTAVNSGNSGGGLFNSSGQLIGIVNAKVSDDSIENIAYAIPSSIASSITQNIIANSGSYKKLSIGITLSSQNSKSVYNSTTGMVDLEEDVIISAIEENSVASNLFEVNDKIVSISIGDKKITIKRMYEVVDYLNNVRLNDNVTFEIKRGDTTKDIPLTVQEANLVVG